MDFGGGDEIRFERLGHAGVVTLTRPAALNALTHRMVRALSAALAAWEADPAVAVVIVRAEGRAFCAGGDIMQVYREGRAGRPPVGFFADEYRLNAAIARFPKPYVSLIDGIVMGGGVGISGHGSHRVMTENALFAMPEVGIGFFPDVGASHLLPRLKGSFGMYLGLTGNRIRWGDACWAGLATHAVRAEDLAELVGGIAETGSPDRALKGLTASPDREIDEAAVHLIQRDFSLGDLDGILSALAAVASADEFAAKTLDLLHRRSPTSLHVTFRLLAAGAMLSMDDCMKMEFRVVNRMLEGHDLYEGIRAAIVDKGATPAWRPATLAEVEPARIEAYFEPLSGGELVP